MCEKMRSVPVSLPVLLYVRAEGLVDRPVLFGSKDIEPDSFLCLFADIPLLSRPPTPLAGEWESTV